MARTVIPEREREICHRLRLWRESMEFTRVKLAASLRVKVEWLAGYEYARAPIRYDAAQRIVAGLAINPVWLATGRGPIRPAGHVPLPMPDELGVSPRDLFSSVYDAKLKPKFESDTRLVEPAEGTHAAFSEAMLHIESKVAAEEYLRKRAHAWLRNISNKNVSMFLSKLVEYGDLLCTASEKVPPKDRKFVESEMAFISKNLKKRARK